VLERAAKLFFEMFVSILMSEGVNRVGERTMASNSWLHCIGKVYYSVESFREEAFRLGVSRRVALKVLQRMSWGDRVCLVQADQRKRTRRSPLNGAKWVGTFLIESLLLDRETVERLSLQGLKIRDASSDEDELIIERGCGLYKIVGLSYIEASLFDIAQELLDLEKQGVDVGFPMIGGRFRCNEPDLLLSDITFFWGFRLFDWEAFQRALGVGPWPPDLVIPGEFRVSELSDVEEESEGWVQLIEGYERRPL